MASIPVNTEEVQYSLPFSIAAAFVRGTIGVPKVTENGSNDPQVFAIVKTVEIAEDDTFNAAFPASRFARAHFHLNDGRVLSSDVTKAQGDPEAKVDDQVVWDGFRTQSNLCSGQIAPAQFLKTAQGVADAPSLKPLFDLMTHPRQSKDPR